MCSCSSKGSSTAGALGVVQQERGTRGLSVPLGAQVAQRYVSVSRPEEADVRARCVSQMAGHSPSCSCLLVRSPPTLPYLPWPPVIQERFPPSPPCPTPFTCPGSHVQHIPRQAGQPQQEQERLLLTGCRMPVPPGGSSATQYQPLTAGNGFLLFFLLVNSYSLF